MVEARRHNGRIHQNLNQIVAQHVRDLILAGQLRAGERLDQDAIADELGVSRLPVREALITLESEGMVENFARRGAFVAQLEPIDFLDHYRMFGVISGIAAARAAETKSVETVERLRAIQAQLREATDPDTHDELNYQFHQAINRSAGSRRLTSVLRMLANNMPSHFYERNAPFRNQGLEEHEAIIAAIESGDADRAAAAVATHFLHTGEQAVRTLQEAGFWREASAT